MSGPEVILGIAAGGAGLLSLGIQLAELATKLDRLYHDVQNAPKTLKKLVNTCETMSLILRTVETQCEEDLNNLTLLHRCLEACKGGTASIQGAVNKLEAYISRHPKLGRVIAVLRNHELQGLLEELEHAKSSLLIALDMYRADRCNAQHAQVMASLACMSAQTLQLSHGYIQSPQQQLATSTSTMVVRDQTQPISSCNRRRHALERPSSDVSPFNSRGQGRKRRKDTKRKDTKPIYQMYMRWPWLTSQVWQLAVLHASNGWNVQIRVSYEVPWNSEIFNRCREGDVQGMQDLVLGGKASFLDSTDGRSLLLHAAAYQQSELCKYLLDEVSWPDPMREMAIALSWVRFWPDNPLTEMYRLCIEEHGFDVDLDSLSYKSDGTWRKSCRTEACRALVLRNMSSPWQTMPVAERLKFALMTPLESEGLQSPADFLHLAGIYFSEADLVSLPSIDRLDLFWRVGGQLAYAIKYKSSGSFRTLDQWMQLGTILLRAGIDRHRHRKTNTYYGPDYATPLLSYLRSFEVLRSFDKQLHLAIDDVEQKLSLWVAMVQSAGIDAQEYFLRENAVLDTTGSYSLNCSEFILAKFVYNSSSSNWSVHLRRKPRLVRILQLDAMPGSFSFDGPLLPKICWKPSLKERREGHWTAVQEIWIHSSAFDARSRSVWQHCYFSDLIEQMQDDAGAVMLMLARSRTRSATRQRSNSSPPPTTIKEGTCRMRERSNNHDWLPSYHQCPRDSRFRTYCFSMDEGRMCFDSSPLPPLSVHNTLSWKYSNFLEQIKRCVQTSMNPASKLRYLDSLAHSGSADCPQGCHMVDVNVIDRLEASIARAGYIDD